MSLLKRVLKKSVGFSLRIVAIPLFALQLAGTATGLIATTLSNIGEDLCHCQKV